MAPESDPPRRVPWLPVNEGASADAPAEPAAPERLTPTKPPVPSWIRRDAVPQAVEDEDEGDLVAPAKPPAAHEVLPPLGVESAPAEDTDDANDVRDAVQLLGDSAVASAALSASGAPTPLGGVPLVPARDAVNPPSFGDEAPLFTPQFVDQVPASQVPNPYMVKPAATDVVDHEHENLALRAAALDAGAAYAPQSFDVAPLEDDADGADGEMPTPQSAPETNAAAPLPSRRDQPIPASGGGAEEDPSPEPQPDGDEPPSEPPAEPPAKDRGKWWLWVVIGLVAVAVILVIVAVVYKPAPHVNPGSTVTLSPPASTITPIAAPTATEFQAAMPTTVGTFALVEATPLDPTDVALGAGRLADGVDLTYRSGTDTMSVRALQYYTEAEAQEMFTHFVGESATTTPVEVGGTVVGESAPITKPAAGIVWRNGTSLFILTGPAGQLQGFYEQFGL